MMGAWIAAGLDTFYFLWFWLPGAAWAMVWGFRHWIDILGFGFIVSAFIANLTFLFAYFIGYPELFVDGLRILLAAALLTSVIWLRHVLAPFFVVSSIALITVGFAAVLRNVMRLDGWMVGYDHIVTAISAHLIQSGELSEETISEAIYKKGLTFPIIFALGRDELLLGVTPVVIFVLLLAVTYRLTELVLEKTNPRVRFWLWAGSVALWGTSDMFCGFPFHQHGHSIVALGIAVYAMVLFRYLKKPRLSWTSTGALLVAGVVLSQSRFEAFILVFLLTLPILWSLREKSETTQGVLHTIAISLAWPIGYGLWIGSLGNFPVSGVSIALVNIVALSAAVTVATTLYYAPKIRVVLIHFVWVTLLGLTAAYLLFARNGQDWDIFSANTFFGEGQWGAIWWVAVIAVLFLAVARKTSLEALGLWFAVSILLMTILLKTTDGFPQGRLGTIRLGWSDSVNRTLFHSFPLVTLVLTIAFDKILQVVRNLFWSKRGRRSETRKLGNPIVRRTYSPLRSGQ